MLPSSCPVVGQVIKIAGSKGLTRHAAIILVDPLLEPKAQPATKEGQSSLNSLDVENLQLEFFASSESLQNQSSFPPKPLRKNYATIRLKDVKEILFKRFNRTYTERKQPSAPLPEESNTTFSEPNVNETNMTTETYKINYENDFRDDNQSSLPEPRIMIYETPIHLASLPVEVARSVFISVPKSVGNGEADDLEEEPSAKFEPPEISFGKDQFNHNSEVS